MKTTQTFQSKRLIAIVLSVVLLLQAMPWSAIAESGDTGLLRGSETYTVTFVADDVEVEQLLVTAGDALQEANLPTAPEKEDGRFIGWYIGDATEPVSFPYTPTGDVTLTAKYQSAYLVTFMERPSSIRTMFSPCCKQLRRRPSSE